MNTPRVTARVTARINITATTMLDYEQETQILMAERDYAYKLMWDEMKYGKFAEAANHAEDYAALAASIAYTPTTERN